MRISRYPSEFGNPSTDDIALWVEDTNTNRKNRCSAFIALGYGDIPGLETMEFIPGWTIFHIGNSMELDIVTKMKGLENTSFSDCLNQASIADLDKIKIPFLHINQVIQNKKAVNRPKDPVDIIELENKKVKRNQQY